MRLRFLGIAASCSAFAGVLLSCTAFGTSDVGATEPDASDDASQARQDAPPGADAGAEACGDPSAEAECKKQLFCEDFNAQLVSDNQWKVATSGGGQVMLGEGRSGQGMIAKLVAGTQNEARLVRSFPVSQTGSLVVDFDLRTTPPVFDSDDRSVDLLEVGASGAEGETERIGIGWREGGLRVFGLPDPPELLALPTTCAWAHVRFVLEATAGNGGSVEIMIDGESRVFRTDLVQPTGVPDLLTVAVGAWNDGPTPAVEVGIDNLGVFLSL